MICSRRNLPVGWVWNVLDSQALYALDPHGRYWLRFENGAVFVPITFGQIEVSLD